MSLCGCGRRNPRAKGELYAPLDTRWSNMYAEQQGRHTSPHGWLRIRPGRVFLLAIIGMLFTRAAAQFKEDSPLYIREVQKQEALLKEQLKSLPEVELTFYPERAFDDPDYYIYSPPAGENYKIGLILDPCKGKEPTCCMNVFGSPEYGLKTKPDMTYPYRVVPKYDLGDDSEILANVDVVDQDRSPVGISKRRRADDMAALDESCNGMGDPFTYCTGFRKRQSPFPLVPACRDNNQTVNATRRCYDPPLRKWSDNCVQVGYMQTALSVLCGNEHADDPHCGTFLEIHMPNGSPDFDKDYKIAERKITVRNTTGYLTTTIPLYFTANDSKIMPGARRLLCEYQESKLRVGSNVLIKDTAPLCCCPHSYNLCPRMLYDSGPTCPSLTTLAQKLQIDSSWYYTPYCYAAPEKEDWVMCSRTSAALDRTVYYRCPFTEQTSSGFGSALINNTHYKEQCPYFPECVLSYVNETSYCRHTEDPFTFKGMVGTVTRVPAAKVNADESRSSKEYGVTFNNGRSDYTFHVDDLILDPPPYNYELWWVQRTRYNYVIQKKKPFRVRTPTCTYDSQRQEYFPYALQLPDGSLVDTI